MSDDPAINVAPIVPPTPLCTIHEADRGGGPTGAILYDREIDFDEAVARRTAGLDVVVRGNDVNANRRLAEAIESAVGPCKRNEPHRRAGPLALPHFQPEPRPPEGHTFYETSQRKARRRR